MKRIFALLFALIVLLAQGCQYIEKMKGEDKQEIPFRITPTKIIATDVGLSSTIRIVKPEDYDPEKLIWENTNPAVVQVRDGKVYAQKDGKSTVYVRYQGKDNWVDTCAVQVNRGFKLVEGLRVEPARKTLTQIGRAVKLNATVKPLNATQKVTWRSLHPNIAEVNSNGRVTALSQGNAQIVATSYIDTTQSDTATVELEVKDDFVFTAVPGMRKQQEAFRYILKQASQQTSDAGFFITPGNLDPVNEKYNAFRKALGSQHNWYPVVDYFMLPEKGNEAEKYDNIKWLRNYFSVLPAINKPGPDESPNTMYSFDYGNIHVIVINPFYNGNTDISEKATFSDPLYDWLRNDLANNAGRYNVVVSGVPAFPEDNASTYGFADENDRRQLWQLLQKNGVMAYITGGNKVAMKKHQGIWQISTGNGQDGLLSFITVRVQSSRIIFERFSGRVGGVFNKVATEQALLSDYM